MTTTDDLRKPGEERDVVLVVEDEALVRMNACDMTGDMGFEVLEAADAVEALGVVEARSDIDVVVTAYQDKPKPEWPLLTKLHNAKALEKMIHASIAA